MNKDNSNIKKINKSSESKHENVIINKVIKKKQKNIMKITKKVYKNMHEINIENYLMK